eukprot:391145_1
MGQGQTVCSCTPFHDDQGSDDQNIEHKLYNRKMNQHRNRSQQPEPQYETKDIESNTNTSDNELTLPDDLSTFQKEIINECKSVETCQIIKRLAVALKYYSSLDVVNNSEQQDTFIDFITMNYTKVLDDYVHLVNHHGNDLSEINDQLAGDGLFSDCNISNCSFTARHYQTNNNYKNASDSALHFYKQTMDSLHFYLLHLFDTGLRTRNVVGNDEMKRDDEYFDASFSRMHKTISERQRTTKSFERFKQGNNSKFNISTNCITTVHKDTGGATYLDKMFAYLLERKVDQPTLVNLQQFLNAQEYDSEAVSGDLDGGNEHDGNIYTHINNTQCVENMKACIQTAKTSSTSLSIGLRFYYWRYYLTIKQIPREKSDNVNDHGGHDICSLFVEKKYASFKEEILNYEYIPIQQYENEILVKAENYENTEIVKSTTASLWCAPEHYGVLKDEQLSLKNLLSLILYCDCTDLCTNFSSTFRQISPFEMLQSIKKRNSVYWWLSKTLRETVEVFGCNSRGPYRPTMTGPYYCGMSVVLNIPSFHIRLCSPTST